MKNFTKRRRLKCSHNYQTVPQFRALFTWFYMLNLITLVLAEECKFWWSNCSAYITPFIIGLHVVHHYFVVKHPLSSQVKDTYSLRIQRSSHAARLEETQNAQNNTSVRITWILTTAWDSIVGTFPNTREQHYKDTADSMWQYRRDFHEHERPALHGYRRQHETVSSGLSQTRENSMWQYRRDWTNPECEPGARLWEKCDELSDSLKTLISWQAEYQLFKVQRI
jgi:hypothetical protein